MIYIVSPGGAEEKGGMGRIVSNFTSDLRQHYPDMQFEIIDTYGPGKFRLMPFYFLAATMYLFGRFLSNKAQLVHVHMADYGSVLRKGVLITMASLFRVPVILHMHGGRFAKHYEDAGPTSRWAIRQIIAMTNEIVVLGDYWRQWVVDSFGSEARRVTVLHNAVPAPPTLPAHREGGPVRLLFLGRLVKLKGIDVLLEALASKTCRDKNWELTIAGDGEMEIYRAQVEALGLASRVRFTGWLDHTGCLRELLAADVLVQPSLFEGLPMSILEAMAGGLPIVATPVGSVSDAIQDQVTGILVPPGDCRALAQALTQVIEDPALRRRLGVGARQMYEQQFDIAIYRRRIIEIYQRNARNSWRDPTAYLQQP
jgi:glycosyltransferase involved in cell wall biosynthesis